MTTTQTAALEPIEGPGHVAYPLLDRWGQDPAELLTIDELDRGSQTVQVDLLVAVNVAHAHPKRSAALAVVAWLLARRQDPKVQLSPFRALTVNQLGDLIWPEPEPDPGADDDDDVDDLAEQPQPADLVRHLATGDDDDVDDLDPMAAAVVARPTDPTPAP